VDVRPRVVNADCNKYGCLDRKSKIIIKKIVDKNWYFKKKPKKYQVFYIDIQKKGKNMIFLLT